MAIYIFKGDRNFKSSKYTSSQELIDVFDLEEVIDGDKMDKELSKGNNVYVIIDPYISNMRSGEEGTKDIMRWYNNPEQAADNYYDLADNV